MSATATLFTRITAKQRKALFGIMEARGLDLDDLRAMTPNNSVSKMSVVEAGRVLDRLNAGTKFQRDAHDSKRPNRKPRAPRGVIRLVSHAQRGEIERLRVQLGWTAQGLHDFLAERHYSYDCSRGMSDMQTARDAHQVIELLKHILARKSHGTGFQPVDQEGGKDAAAPF